MTYSNRLLWPQPRHTQREDGVSPRDHGCRAGPARTGSARRPRRVGTVGTVGTAASGAVSALIFAPFAAVASAAGAAAAAAGAVPAPLVRGVICRVVAGAIGKRRSAAGHGPGGCIGWKLPAAGKHATMFFGPPQSYPTTPKVDGRSAEGRQKVGRTSAECLQKVGRHSCCLNARCRGEVLMLQQVRLTATTCTGQPERSTYGLWTFVVQVLEYSSTTFGQSYGRCACVVLVLLSTTQGVNAHIKCI